MVKTLAQAWTQEATAIASEINRFAISKINKNKSRCDSENRSGFFFICLISLLLVLVHSFVQTKFHVAHKYDNGVNFAH